MFKANYSAVNEETARIAKEMNSFYDYKKGSATKEQNEYVDSIVEYANKLLEKNQTEDQEKIERVQYYIDKYSEKLAEAIDKQNSIETRCPSMMIAGPSNFPVRKKEKQNAARDSFFRDYGYLFKTDKYGNHYYKEIFLVLTDNGVIASDDKNAVGKIKEKIKRLEIMDDPYGNKKAEIRRLKERLLVLSPDEMKAGKEITINGKCATFENIVALFDNYKPRKSVYKSLYTEQEEPPRYYLEIPVTFYDGKRNYREFISEEVTEDGTQISTYGNAENGYKPIWKPLDDYKKFNLVIGKISGSGNKAVIYSILRDLDPRRQKTNETATPSEKTATINGEKVTIKANAEEMRLQLFFDGKPQEETRSILKSNGFKWAPSQGAWQRLLNSNATSALNRIVTN
jgi:hypothetical protein